MTEQEAKRAAWALCDEEERAFWRDYAAVFGEHSGGRWPGGIEWGKPLSTGIPRQAAEQLKRK